MKQRIIAIVTCLTISSVAFAQTAKTFTIDLNDAQSIKTNLIMLATDETSFWNDHFDFDSTMKSRLYNNNFSIYMQYVEVMKQFNYKMESVLLNERFNFVTRRDRFMKTFLTDEQYKKYEGMAAIAAKKELAAYNDNASNDIQALRKQAAGWNVIEQTIVFQ